MYNASNGYLPPSARREGSVAVGRSPSPRRFVVFRRRWNRLQIKTEGVVSACGRVLLAATPALRELWQCARSDRAALATRFLPAAAWSLVPRPPSAASQ